jgi:hypothetical protein
MRKYQYTPGPRIREPEFPYNMNNFHFNLTDSQGRAQTTGPLELMEDLRGRENIIPVS